MEFFKDKLYQEINMLHQNLELSVPRQKQLPQMINGPYFGDLENNLAGNKRLETVGTKKKDTNPDQEEVMRNDVTNETCDINTLHVSSFTEQLKMTPKITNKHDKETRRKESHNKIEKKRMSFINERIKELENLLPENARRRTKQRKGQVLKESVEYLKELLEDHKNVKRLQNRIEDINREVEQLSSRLQTIASRMEFSENTYQYLEEDRNKMIF